MKQIQENHQGPSTFLAFALIPLSGFATDIYLPSLPSMASHLQVSGAAVQLSLVVFMISYGIGQLFVGSLLDSFGRFKLNIASLAVFALASFVIALTNNIYLIYLMRVIHGITVAFIVVGKRAYFVDIYKGEKLKHYTSLFSIIWASAPIIAPFIGGYLQETFGWQSNFYFLGILAFTFMVLELIFSGESLQQFHPFHLKTIVNVYSNILKTTDYTLGLVILALCYSMLLVFGMSSPFIIEHLFHQTSVVTGYAALLSGVALMAGGMLSKALIKHPLIKKVSTAILAMVLVAVLMIALSVYIHNLYILMPFVLLLHMFSGFIFNNYMSYSLGRFSKNAGMVSGITGGGNYVVTSILSYTVLNSVSIQNPMQLGIAYLAIAALLGITFMLFIKARYAQDATVLKPA
ncbi:Predicted arabinose efflux permease, MFS family [Filimonas lacunae]|uniref:Predicted arabinose efflux permease, MFS family n=1 Tax=Filimonas lacunae TaxID=477680 RepID=A0A173MA54_9BACT|nr:MFS transporter [Filimonas lacunae]BAV04348.1 drug resistance transporter, Bcr/CflA family protein [Filimonas lacunae]SIT31095.1 Predicted arabinose efflux permease, MFS family [Filimonas lacunae]